MKFNVPETMLSAEGLTEVRVGNVYSAKGGKGTAFWVVVAVTENSAVLLGIDRDGTIKSATSYYKWVLEGNDRYAKGRPILGFIEGLDELSFDIAWGTP